MKIPNAIVGFYLGYVTHKHVAPVVVKVIKEAANKIAEDKGESIPFPSARVSKTFEVARNIFGDKGESIRSESVSKSFEEKPQSRRSW